MNTKITKIQVLYLRNVVGITEAHGKPLCVQHWGGRILLYVLVSVFYSETLKFILHLTEKFFRC